MYFISLRREYHTRNRENIIVDTGDVIKEHIKKSLKESKNINIKLKRNKGKLRLLKQDNQKKKKKGKNINLLTFLRKKPMKEAMTKIN